jgi:uncharacterized protein
MANSSPPFQAVNTTQGVALVSIGRLAHNSWTRLKGLIGVHDLPEGDGLWIKPCKGVHCMFMSIPIDVIILDRDAVVIGLEPNLKPWRIGKVYRRGASVLELPSGMIARTGTALGDQIQLST